jgi:CheY-like chemotaxis protein
MHTPTILIVDDTPTNVELLERLLSAEGFHTLTAADGPTARAVSRA